MCFCVVYSFVVYISYGSGVIPSILGLMFMGSVVYSDVSDVKRVHVVLPNKLNRTPIYGGRKFLTQFVQMSATVQHRV